MYATDEKGSRGAEFARLLALSARPTTAEQGKSNASPKPSWLKVAKVHGDGLFSIKRNLRKGTLHTVCEEAKCPNISECMNAGTATFMILGDTCTRGCRFCNVKTGNPRGVLDANEPEKIALSIERMKLDYAVITMVDRDDLFDGGAAHIAATLATVHGKIPHIIIEILAGDFQGKESSIATVVQAGRGLDVFAHNLETVRSLSPKVRDPRARYDLSLATLTTAKRIRPQTILKSGIMLGLGEDLSEIEVCLQDLRNAGVEVVTIGQYLQPTPKHLAVARYAHPEEFEYWRQYCVNLGFRGVASGPLVRSSYRAAHLFSNSSTPPGSHKT